MKKKFLIIFLVLSLGFIIIKKNLIDKCLTNIDISIIIPIYNRELYLPSCLNSITRQSLRNIEIICIDDGSTDNSLQILIEYKKRDKRIIIIHQNSQGPAIARNLGIKISKGKFIAFIDSDDLYPNEYVLELMYNKAIQNKVLICGGGINFIKFKQNNTLITKQILFPINKISYYYDYQYDFYFQRFIYNTTFIKKNKLYFPNYLRFQDPPFFIKAMALSKYFYSLRNITYIYRVQEKSIILNERKIIDVYKGIRDCLSISKSFNLYKLYNLELSRLNSKLIINYAKKYINNPKLKSIILQIINNIDYNLLMKENLTFIKNEFYIQLL